MAVESRVETEQEAPASSVNADVRLERVTKHFDSLLQALES